MFGRALVGAVAAVPIGGFFLFFAVYVFVTASDWNSTTRVLVSTACIVAAAFCFHIANRFLRPSTPKHVGTPVLLVSSSAVIVFAFVLLLPAVPEHSLGAAGGGLLFLLLGVAGLALAVRRGLSANYDRAALEREHR